MKIPIPHWFTVTAGAFLLATFAIPAQPAEKGKKQLVASHATETQPLVWPLPPDPPRIRWERQISDYKDVRGEKKKKASWMERVAGAKTEEEKKEEKLEQPYGIAVDSRGRIFVADGKKRGVIVFDAQQKAVDVWGVAGRAPLGLPIGLAVDAEDRLFVSDAKTRAITGFSGQGETVARFGDRELTRPAGLAIDKDRKLLYVADAKANRVSVFDLKTFALVKHIGNTNGPRTEPGSFATPTNVAVDRQGNLYVTDTFNARVQIFDRRGRFQRTFGEYGDAPGSFAFPKGIAVDSEGHIYVADARFNNFQIFDQQGRTLLFVGSPGRQPGQFVMAAGVCIDGEDRIYVSDFSGRVQIFRYISQPQTAAERR